MVALDPKVYKDDVIMPMARKYDRALREALSEMKVPGTRRPSALDLTFVYQVTPGMSDADIAARIKDVELQWNNEYQKTRNPKIRAAADFVRQLHELLHKNNVDVTTNKTDFITEKWWSKSMAEKQTAKLGTISKLASVLEHSPYAGLKYITPERIAVIAGNDASFSVLAESDLEAAAKEAGLTVVAPVALPADSGIATYDSLVGALDDATDGTIVHAVFFVNPPTSFNILGSGADGTPFGLSVAGGLRLDASSTGAALVASTKSASREATARTRALSMLKEAAARGADLDALAVFHLADIARRKSEGGILQIAYLALMDTGLDPVEAARIVLSVKTGTETRGVAITPELVHANLAEGALDAAEAALLKLEAIVKDDQGKAETEAVRAAFEAQRARVQQLRDSAASAIRANDIAAARAALDAALRLDRDSEDIARDLASLPPDPPINVSVASAVTTSGDTTVRVAWQAGLGSDDETRFRVVRKVGSPPVHVGDGTVIGEVAATTINDDQPEFVDTTHYAVFAFRGKGFSLPGAGSITVVPTISGLTLTATPTGVGGHWSNPPQAIEATVVQVAPDGTRTRIPLSSSASFVSDHLVQGQRYQFEVTAHYRSRTGAAAASQPVVKDAVPRAEARPVPTLTVKPVTTADGACRIEAQWSRQPHHEVQLWCFPQEPPLAYGSRVTPKALSDKGRQLHGQGGSKASVSTLVADVPSGLMHYLAITVDDAERVVGQVDQLGICEPVGNPKVQRFGDEAVLSWDWPDADYSVRAVWSGPSTSGEQVISKPTYDKDGGMRIRVGSGRSDIRLASFIDHAGSSWQSPVRTLSVEASSATITYGVTWQTRMFSSASGFDVQIVSDVDVIAADLIIGYRADRVMPSLLRQIEELRRETLTLDGGEPVTITVALPKMPKHYWVRCFLESADGVRLIDPPTDDLKGR
ncbi:hypothetical protein [Mycobacterium sp. NPDC050041]|uniref:hypothetical protein n=1 Tax=Mycobacterium sp. NPDC050041 TaxID=3364293 RepID=UPI003C30B284